MFTTFEEWSKSKVWHNKLSAELGIEEDMSGFIYADGSFIALTQMPPIGKPGWWTIVERSELLDQDLTAVEAWLWSLWSKDNIGE